MASPSALLRPKKRSTFGGPQPEGALREDVFDRANWFDAREVRGCRCETGAQVRACASTCRSRTNSWPTQSLYHARGSKPAGQATKLRASRARLAGALRDRRVVARNQALRPNLL